MFIQDHTVIRAARTRRLAAFEKKFCLPTIELIE